MIRPLMRTRLYHIWENLKSSYWFVPLVMLIGSAALSTLTLAIDQKLPKQGDSGWFYGGGIDGARSLLSAISSTVITAASITFSITIAALTQASSQFGPRLLRNFMRDRGNQIVLGTFVATFLYCLLVLRVTGNIYGTEKVPHLSITVAVALAIASLLVLIYFIHHVAQSIQAPQVIATTGEELLGHIGRSYPSHFGQDWSPPDSGYDWPIQSQSRLIELADEDGGYVTAVDGPALMRLAKEHNLHLQLLVRPGGYVTHRSPLLYAYPKQRIDQDLSEELEGAFLINTIRTAEQDVEFSVNQLVEIALRALSPGINDPFTATNCLDWLTTFTINWTLRPEPTAYRADDAGQVRARVHLSDFAGLVDAGFNQLRQVATDHVVIVLHLLDRFNQIGRQLKTPAQRQAVRRQVDMLWEAVEKEAKSYTFGDFEEMRRLHDVASETLNPPLQKQASPMKSPQDRGPD